MSYNFALLKGKVTDTEGWFKKELQGIRTGRATPTLLDSISVESYGAKLPISQIAAITGEDARTLRITPWDTSQTKAIEKAIVQSNLGISVAIDDRGVRALFPELTSERRAQLMKIIKERLEQAKVALRGERDKVWSDIQNQERDGKISKDDKFRHKEEMEKIITDAGKRLEEVARRKEQEILS